jgi:hypothetical protein
MNTAGGVFGQYNLCNRYNGYTDFQKFVQNQASFPLYNHHSQLHDSINHGQFTPAFSEYRGHHHHHHATSHPTTGLQFIADVTENYYCHWNNGAIVQQPYYNHANYAAMVPNPSTMGPHPFPPIVYDQAVQTTDYVFPQESSAKHMDGFQQITTNTNHGNLHQHTFDSRPTRLKRRDSCVFCRVYDGKEPNEIMFRVSCFMCECIKFVIDFISKKFSPF